MTAAAPLEVPVELAETLSPRLNKYIPWEPTDTQTAFLLLNDKEVLYGGAAGGGKSVALLAAALQYVDVPGYHALLLRRTFAALSKPGALIDLAHEWLSNTDATWNEQRKQWTFPSGATLSFGYLDTESDKYQYQGAAFQFVGFDELTQFTLTQYLYLFSRARKRANVDIPIRVRAASNPGGEGHAWVYQRFFVEGDARGRVFIPAKLTDNPHLDTDSYLENLRELPLVERLQLEKGDWLAKTTGGWFRPEWLPIIAPEEVPRIGVRLVRYWDLASTKPSARNKDPDFTRGVLMAAFRGTFYVLHVASIREGPAETEAFIATTAEGDGRGVDIWIEQEPGAQSELFIHGLARGRLQGYSVRGNRVTGSKATRAKPFAAACDNGLVKLVRGPWNREFIDELVAFPTAGVHDDQLDGASGAHEKLTMVDETPPPSGESEFSSRPTEPEIRL